MARNSSALNLDNEEGKENAKKLDDDYLCLPWRSNCCLRHGFKFVNLLLQFKVTHVI